MFSNKSFTPLYSKIIMDPSCKERATFERESTLELKILYIWVKDIKSNWVVISRILWIIGAKEMLEDLDFVVFPLNNQLGLYQHLNFPNPSLFAIVLRRIHKERSSSLLFRCMTMLWMLDDWIADDNVQWFFMNPHLKMEQVLWFFLKFRSALWLCWVCVFMFLD